MKITKKYPGGLEIEIETSDWLEQKETKVSKIEQVNAYEQYRSANSNYDYIITDFINELDFTMEQKELHRKRISDAYTSSMMKVYEMGLVKYPLNKINETFEHPCDLK